MKIVDENSKCDNSESVSNFLETVLNKGSIFIDNVNKAEVQFDGVDWLQQLRKDDYLNDEITQNMLQDCQQSLSNLEQKVTNYEQNKEKNVMLLLDFYHFNQDK